MKTTNILPVINADRSLSFNGVRDTRYTFPVWSMLSRRSRIFFNNGKSEVTLHGHGTLEVLIAAADHRQSINN